MYKKCEKCYENSKTPSNTDCEKCNTELKRKTQECEEYKQALNEIRNIIASGDVGIRPKLYDFEQDNKILDIINRVKEKNNGQI